MFIVVAMNMPLVLKRNKTATAETSANLLVDREDKCTAHDTSRATLPLDNLNRKSICAAPSNSREAEHDAVSPKLAPTHLRNVDHWHSRGRW